MQMSTGLIPVVSNEMLDKLPLFAEDHELVLAIVGKKRAIYFKSVLPTLEREGFPAPCPLHGGRSVHLVRLFYTAKYSMDIRIMESNIQHAAIEKAQRQTDERFAQIARERAEKKARAKANADARAEKKRQALEEFKAKKATNNGSKAAKKEGEK